MISFHRSIECLRVGNIDVSVYQSNTDKFWAAFDDGTIVRVSYELSVVILNDGRGYKIRPCLRLVLVVCLNDICLRRTGK